MAKIKFIEKESYFRCHHLYFQTRIKYTPVFMVKGSVEYFVRNIVDDKREEVDLILNQLVKNDGKFWVDYCHMRDIESPIQFAEKVKEMGWHYQDPGLGRYNTKESKVVDFQGNLKERSCAFSFRIYDSKMIQKVAKISGVALEYFKEASK